jgi:hypothetical protein
MLFFCLRNDDEGTLKSLKARMAQLATQVAVLERLEPIARLIRRDEQLPIRKLNFNIKKLSEDDAASDKKEESRWTCLRELGCEQAIFCMICFNGLANLAGDDFEWLVTNVQKHMMTQKLPHRWVTRDQIKKVLARAPWRPNTVLFLESKFFSILDYRARIN